MKRLLLDRISVRQFRNIDELALRAAPRLNLIVGNNGQGKTSLLEAIYFVATSRSFRTSKLHELVGHGRERLLVNARFVETQEGLSPLGREQTAALESRRCVVRIDGNRPRSLAEFATRSPVVAFHPDEMHLSTGPAPGRRLLLDRIALFTDPLSSDHRARYAEALRSRQLLLQSVRTAAALPQAELSSFEELCAMHGAALTRARRTAAVALAHEARAAFARIGAPNLRLDIEYAAGGSDDEAIALRELSERRRVDGYRKNAGFGPHRDDLVISLDGHSARAVASQGQHRAITLALKAGETACIASARGIEPILLLDDVSSELDRDRTDALLEFLGSARGQIFLTTTRRDLFGASCSGGSERADFELRDGQVRQLA